MKKLVWLVLVIGFVGWAQTPKLGGEMVLAFGTDPESLDPQQNPVRASGDGAYPYR